MRAFTLALILLGTTSCAKGGALSSIVESMLPSADFRKVSLDHLDFKGVDATLHFSVNNPNPIRVHLASWSWGIALDGTNVLSGNENKGLDLEASGSSQIRVPIHLVYNDLAKLVTGLNERTDIPFALTGSIGLNTPLGVAKIPLRAHGKLPVPQVPKIAVNRVEFKGVDLTSVKLAVVLNLSHKYAKTMAVSGLTYGVGLDGGSIIKGTLPNVPPVEPGQTAEVTLPLELSLVQAGTSLVSHLTQKHPVKVNLNLGMDVQTPWGAIPLKWTGDDLVNVFKK